MYNPAHVPRFEIVCCYRPVGGCFGAAGQTHPAATIRLDYYHTGDTSREVFSFDRYVVEPLPWPGNPHRPIDDTNLGKYLFEVRDRASNRLLYSRGFSSIYGEWETTDEARA